MKDQEEGDKGFHQLARRRRRTRRRRRDYDYTKANMLALNSEQKEKCRESTRWRFEGIYYL